jgi:hypothetical protein
VSCPLRFSSLLIAAIIELALRSTGFAADPRFADWPCMQIKVPEISAAAVWSGPPIDDVRNAWQEDPAVRDLVGRLAARRTALDDGQRTISDFITGNAAERQKKAKLLFAGLLARLNAERSEVMDGIERFFRQQKELAAKTRLEISELRQLQDVANQDQAKTEELANRVAWDTRIFDERRRTISFACEVPVLIEQRLFGLARMIEQTIE